MLLFGKRMPFPRTSLYSREFLQWIVAAAVLFVGGCTGDGAAARYTVTGKVTYQGQPVEEGMIQFENPDAGQSNSSPLGPGGAYALDVPAGPYKVTVMPPKIMAKGTADSPPDEIDDPNVKNIPKKYRRVETSGLAAQVEKGQTTFDFELKP